MHAQDTASDTSRTPGARQRRGRARAAIGALVALSIVGGMVVVARAADDGASPGATASAGSESGATSAVSRRTLVAGEELDGTLGFGAAQTVRNLLPATTASEDSAAQSLAAATAAYNAAVRNLDSLSAPDAQAVASARAQLAQAQASLLAARRDAGGPTAAELATARATLEQAKVALTAARRAAGGPTAAEVVRAEATLEQARATLADAQDAAAGPSATELATARAAVEQARASLVAALAGAGSAAVDAAQITVATATATLAAARQALTTCQGGAGPCTAEATAVATAEAALLNAQAALDRARAEQATASAQVAAAEAQVGAAQAALDALTSATAASQRRARLLAAEAGVREAEAALADLTGADGAADRAARLLAAEASVASAQAAYDALRRDDGSALRRAQLASAEAAVSSARASLAALLDPDDGTTASAREALASADAQLDAATAQLLRGTITSIAPEGATVERGELLFEVGGSAGVTLLYGDTPAWRTLERGVTGEDVRQLEANLDALGYGGDDFGIDGTFDAATEAAVRAWQEATGLPVDGVVDLGEVVFRPGPVRVADHRVATGDAVQAGTEVLDVTGTRPVVTVDLAIDDRDLVVEGGDVEVELPSGERVSGTIEAVGTVATAPEDTGLGGGGDPTIEVTVALDDAAATDGLEAAPVTIHVVTIRREDVLAVPVTALVALLEGGYAVEIVDAGGGQLVGVEVGLFDSGWVEIRSGDLDEGDEVRTAA